MSNRKPVDDGYGSLIEPVWLPLNRTWDAGPEFFCRRFRSVPPEVGNLYAAHWCQSEVRNGGLHQFFSNSTGLLAPESLEAFRAIGLIEWATVLAEAMEFFGTPYPRDAGERQAILASVPGNRRDKRDPFRILDTQFFEATTDWEEAADDYTFRYRDTRE